MNIHAPTSYEAALNRHYAAVSSRLRGEPKRVMLKVAPTQAPKQTAASTREQQNDFIKARCQQMNVCYQTIMDQYLSDRAFKVSNQILQDVKERWPNAHVKRLAELFHRKESAIREVLASFKVRSPDRPITPEAVKEMQRLRSEGMKYAEIAEFFGVTADTVGYHLGKTR